MLRQELDMQYYYTNQLNEKDAELADKDKLIQELKRQLAETQSI